jgi:hypothetical protein
LPPPLRWIAAHFDAHLRRSKWSFLWRTTLEAVVLSFAAGLVIAAFGHMSQREALLKMSTGKLVFLVCLFAPVIETLLTQTFPVMIARALRAGFWTQVFASTLLFAAAHFLESFAVGVCAGVIGGFYLALTYVRWREESFGTAFLMTAASHAARNTLAAAVFLLR